MNQDTDDRLRVPASTILILFITLAVITPLATWRMAQQLTSPTVEVITLEDGGDRFRGHWKVGDFEYIVEEAEQDVEKFMKQFQDRFPALSETDWLDDLKNYPPMKVFYFSVQKPADYSLSTPQQWSEIKQRVGAIEKVLFLDPDGDGASSAFICIRSGGSGNYLQLLEFSFDRDNIMTGHQWSDLSKIPEHLAVGYMGHDTFERQSEMLVRTFPIYIEGDSNAEPTGGIRSLIWDFNSGRWRPDPRK